MPSNNNVLHRRRGNTSSLSSPITTASKSTTTSSSVLHVSPSGIDELPIIFQSSIFFGIYALLGASTYISIQTIDALSKSTLGLEKWRYQYIETTLPLLLGAVYVAAGIGHFISSQEFCDIYPPIGTWGIWYLPGSAEFHVAWTGIVEMVGGGGLLFGVVRSFIMMGYNNDIAEEDDDWSLKLIQPISAGTLFVLTVLVTPANIYMYTHGATMGDNMGELDVSFHYVRFVVQVLFLSLLFVVAKDSFFFAWGDELD